mgnify:CR=1 FL=1
MKNGLLLKLDLEEVDFSYEDIDEVKSQRFDKKLLKAVYAKQHKMNSKKWTIGISTLLVMWLFHLVKYHWLSLIIHIIV